MCTEPSTRRFRIQRMPQPIISILYVTARNRAEAKRIANALLKEKLIACANILLPHESLYTWKGKTTAARETLMFLKTKSSQVKKTMRRIAALHSYECPCIIEIDVDDAHSPFARWIGESVR